LVTTDACRDLINILSKYLNPIKAQFFIEEYCKKSDLSLDRFLASDIPKFIIYLAQRQESITSLNNSQFNKLVKGLIEYSNAMNAKLEKNNKKTNHDVKLLAR
jgi:hypothetical protein